MPAPLPAPIVGGMRATSNILILIPAAGASRRMGARDKCLEDVAGQPALRHTACLALSAGGSVLVSLPFDGVRLKGRQAALAGLPVDVVSLPDAGEGMASSLRAGARAALKWRALGLMILLPDMPEVGGDDIRLLLSRFAQAPDHPLRAASVDGMPGHPVIFPARLFPDLERLGGDRGARDVLERNPAVLCPLTGHSAILDLDTPAEWAAWRAGRS